MLKTWWKPFESSDGEAYQSKLPATFAQADRGVSELRAAIAPTATCDGIRASVSSLELDHKRLGGGFWKMLHGGTRYIEQASNPKQNSYLSCQNTSRNNSWNLLDTGQDHPAKEIPHRITEHNLGEVIVAQSHAFGRSSAEVHVGV